MEINTNLCSVEVVKVINVISISFDKDVHTVSPVNSEWKLVLLIKIASDIIGVWQKGGR